MPSKFRTYTLLTLLTSLLLSPKLADESQSELSIFNPPPTLTRQQVLSHPNILATLPTSQRGNLDILRVASHEGIWLTALEAQPQDIIEARGLHGLRNCTVLENSASRFAYREDIGVLQKIEHSWDFELFTEHSGQQTLVKYKRVWKGNLLLVLLRQVPVLRELVGEGLPVGKRGGLEALKEVVSELQSGKRDR